MKILGVFLALLMNAASTFGQISVPPLMNYQGRLTQSNGTPVPDGTYPMRFSIFDQAIEGSEKWSQTVEAVTVKNGVFAVLLGRACRLRPPCLMAARTWRLKSALTFP